MVTTDESNAGGEVQDAFRRFRWLLMGYGAMLVVLGCLAIAYPKLSTVAFDIYIGWPFLFSGIVGLIAASWAGSARLPLDFRHGCAVHHRGRHADLEAASRRHVADDGADRLLPRRGRCADHRRHDVPERTANTWGWMLASGLVDLLLAVVVIVGWPKSAK